MTQDEGIEDEDTPYDDSTEDEDWATIGVAVVSAFEVNKT